MGKHHARIYKGLDAAKLVAVVDQDADRAGMVADELGCASLTDVEQLLVQHPGLGAVSVAVPTIQHAQVAKPLLLRGIACLVEKPLAPTADQAKALAGLATEHDSVLQVGHTERFNPAIRAVAAMKMKPRFIEVDRVSPMTFRSLDVGVVMDMMIHDLDIVLMLAGSGLERVEATGVAVLGEHEDVANARLVFASGCVANLTASRLALKTERKMRVFSEHGYVSLDYAKRSGVMIQKSNNAKALNQVREQLAQGMDMAGVDYSQLINVEQLTMDTGDDDLMMDPLTAQLSGFIEAAKSGDRPMVDGDAGVAAVDAAQRVVEAIRSHQWEGLSQGPV